MEGFEHLVKVALESEKLVVSSNLKFAVSRPMQNDKTQRHGYEIDLVGARHDLLVLASVKSFFGSRGVNVQGFKDLADLDKRTHYPRYVIFNEKTIRDGVVREAAMRFGYSKRDIELRLYVGKFHSASQAAVIDHLRKIRVGRGPIKVVTLNEIIERVLPMTESKMYVNDPVVMTLKALKHEGMLTQSASAQTSRGKR